MKNLINFSIEMTTFQCDLNTITILRAPKKCGTFPVEHGPSQFNPHAVVSNSIQIKV